MELREAIVAIIADTLRVPTASVRDESLLVDLAKDSIALFELLIRFEKALGKQVTYEDIAHIETVGDVITFAGSLPPGSVAAALAAIANEHSEVTA